MLRCVRTSFSKLNKLMILMAVAVCVAAAAFAAPYFAEATQTGHVDGLNGSGYPIYSWGSNTNATLGLGDYGPGTDRDYPQLVNFAGNWVYTSASFGGSFAINSHGELFAWGADWSANTMGQGSNPNQGSGLITTPTRINGANNWTSVSSRHAVVFALNDRGELWSWGDPTGLGRDTATVPANVPGRVGDRSNWVSVTAGNLSGFAINDEGHLYAWGLNQSAMLGLGDATNRATPVRVGDRSDWASVSAGANFAIGLTTGGELFVWGNNTLGQLGLGVYTIRATPTPLPMPANWPAGTTWKTVMTSSESVAAINSRGELYTWGFAGQGLLGRSVNAQNPRNLPGRVGSDSNWVYVMGGGNFFLAINSDYELYGWGQNDSGQLGLSETGGYRSIPTFVLQTHGFSSATRGGGAHTLMLIRLEPISFHIPLEKRLQMPEGTPVPDLDFRFSFERVSFNNYHDYYHFLPPIPDRVINLYNSGTSVTEDRVTVTTGIVNLLDGIEFTQEGVFSYIVSEHAYASGVLEQSNLSFSPARYELNIYVAREDGMGGALFLRAITLTPLVVDNDEQTVGVKTDHLVFTNTYTRTTTGTQQYPGALTISKQLIGDFANLRRPFDFEIIMQPAAFTTDASFEASIYDRDDQFVRSVAFTAFEPTLVQLAHRERLVFSELTVGTTFAVTELAAPDHRAAVTLMIDGAPVYVPANDAANMPLVVEAQFVGAGTNRADFINTHLYSPPTGLSIATLPPLYYLVAAAMLAVLVVSRRWNSFERLSHS